MKLQFLKLQYIADSIIAAAGGIVGDVANLFGQNAANKQAERFQTAQIAQQREWALQDVASQNAYNSPAAQMVRLKQAGLNPNLVYGQGVQGATGMQGSQPRATQAGNYAPQNILSSFKDVGAQVQNSLQASQNLQATKQQMDSMAQTIAGQKLDNTMKDISNIIAQSDPRSIPELRNLFNRIGKENATSQSEIITNQAQASQYLSRAAAQNIDLNDAKNTRDWQSNARAWDENTREWARNAREQAMLQPNINLAIQSLANSVQENAGIRQRNENSAAEFVKILSSSELQDLERINKNDGANAGRYKEVMGQIVDLILLSKAFKGGATPAKSPSFNWQPGQNLKY